MCSVTPKNEPELTSKYPLRRNTSWSAILLDQLIDSATDVGMHLSRIVRRPDVRQGVDRPTVLVLGSGWGGHSLIKVIDTEKFNVVVVSPSNAFLFTPMLASTTVGTVEFRSLLEPVRVANQFVEYFEGRCVSLDLNGKVATCESSVSDSGGTKPTFQIKYDIMVCACGETPASFGVDGVREHAFFLKTVTDAVKLRRRIQEVFELASLPGTTEKDIETLLTFVVVGAGPTGVEFSGTLTDFLREDLKRKYPRLMKYVKLILLQSGDAILTQFDARLGTIAMNNLKKSGVDVRTGQRVVKVEENTIVLGSGDRIDYGVCVWSAGNAINPLVRDIIESIPQQMEMNQNKPRKLFVDPFLRVIGARDVISLGDCSSIVDNPLPPTAQVAGQQGAYVAHVINRKYNVGTGGIDMLPPWKPSGNLSLADKLFSSVTDSIADSTDEDSRAPIVVLKKPFEFLSLGIMASLSSSEAVAQVEAFDGKLNVWGQPAFLLWKSVYITKQVSVRNRILILFDWMKTQVFGRDLSQF